MKEIQQRQQNTKINVEPQKKKKGGGVVERTLMPILWGWYQLSSFCLSEEALIKTYTDSTELLKETMKRSCMCLTVSLNPIRSTEGFWADYLKLYWYAGFY